MKWILVTLIFISNCLHANPEKGKAEIEKFLRENQGLTTPDYQNGANLVGSMKYEKEPEKHEMWQQNQSVDPAHLEEVGANQGMNAKVGEQIINADRKRPRFDEIVNLKLIERAEKFSQNQDQELVEDGSRDRVVTLNTEYSIETCQNARAPEEHQCIKYLKDPNVEVTPAKYSHFWCTSGAHGPDDPSCRAKKYYPQARMYQEKIVKVSQDEWVSECNTLEARKATHECKLIKEECLDDKLHIINGESITRPCWKYQYTYSCQYPVQVSCEPLLKRGCSPLNSKCIFSVNQQIDDRCYIWEQKYQCPIIEDKVQQTTKYERPFCLQGECFSTDYPPNNEMLESVAQLDIFAQMQQDVRSDLNYIFKGGAEGCNRLCLTFKDCCNLSGWGKSLGLVGCSSEEKQLAENRNKGLCIQVGEPYCAERLPLGICLREKTNFCCFQSKLTKAIQQQGRAQLNMNFGTAENPDCRGLTVDEIQRIDFSKLDLTEAFSDLKPKARDPNSLNQKLQQKLKDLQADFKVQTKGEK